MVPFRLTLVPGVPVSDQISFAAKKAIVGGLLRPGDPFPSVRALSKHFKINPNTAQKVVGQLTADGLLEVRPGIGTLVAEISQTQSRQQRTRLLERELEPVAVEALKLGLDLEDVNEAMERIWRRLAPPVVSNRGGSSAS